MSITALFLDIRDFTSSSETMDAKDVVAFLNDYFNKCSTIINNITSKKGHINKYTGDVATVVAMADQSMIDRAISAAVRARITVRAIGRNIFPSTPVRARIGT